MYLSTVCDNNCILLGISDFVKSHDSRKNTTKCAALSWSDVKYVSLESVVSPKKRANTDDANNVLKYFLFIRGIASEPGQPLKALANSAYKKRAPWHNSSKFSDSRDLSKAKLTDRVFDTASHKNSKRNNDNCRIRTCAGRAQKISNLTP
ncbi:hypothetical protein ACU8KH_02645 [Lachancea thermotolerans]